jgi:hypothetical protein
MWCKAQALIMGQTTQQTYLTLQSSVCSPYLCIQPVNTTISVPLSTQIYLFTLSRPSLPWRNALHFPLTTQVYHFHIWLSSATQPHTYFWCVPGVPGSWTWDTQQAIRGRWGQGWLTKEPRKLEKCYSLEINGNETWRGISMRHGINSLRIS